LNQDEIITFLPKLIQTPSVNGADPEEAAARVIYDFAQRRLRSTAGISNPPHSARIRLTHQKSYRSFTCQE
jgi:hypothetical protein